MRTGFAALAAVAMVLVAAPAYAEGDVPDGTAYVCSEGEPYTQVIFEGGDAATLMLESEAIPMAPVPFASGFGYDAMLPAGHYIVRGKGSDVTLTIDDGVPMNCWSDAAATPVSDGEYVSVFGNFSLGGNVRSGPGGEYDVIDSLPFGEPVAIVRSTGSFLDGYAWFEIEYSEGLRGYQWGGIMCSNALHIVDLYDPCPVELDQ